MNAVQREDVKEEASLELGDAYQLLEVPELRGSTLRLLAQYGGGCETHGWQLVGGELARKRVLLGVAHDSRGDRCRARKIEEVLLDLSHLSLILCEASELSVEVYAGDDTVQHILAISQQDWSCS